MNKCPKCGDTGGWYANCRAYGWVQQQGDWGVARNEGIDTNTDGLMWDDTKWVTCVKCGAKILRSGMLANVEGEGK